ncbi:MAG: hypothetical protein HY319_00790 [Armatimonadetes bacterium]|nr:hypothetical protein [Armatimonadota bacterium]
MSIEIRDLPQDEELSARELQGVQGGVAIVTIASMCKESDTFAFLS